MRVVGQPHPVIGRVMVNAKCRAKCVANVARQEIAPFGIGQTRKVLNPIDYVGKGQVGIDEKATAPLRASACM